MRKLLITLILVGVLALATALPAFAAPGDRTPNDPDCTTANAGHDLDGDPTDNTGVDGGPAGKQCVDDNSERGRGPSTQ